MSYALELQEEAVIDMRDAFEWYEQQKTGLGFELIDEIESGFEQICNSPFHYSSINEHFRKLKIKRFPYLVIYEVEALKVIIIAVRHSSKKPKD
ncbi:type II toxin-antitoxin system RelE/ParE family toxin [Pinibacter aurantiacus]|uniref:Type II toxin-antitoxin system RelE/ParE family toxin n=1 Tax=Pinibacter aurantiacus TaxID=2851599 RepID=A0A9E2SBB8_9BACT|nr:type II toxin-antitoxin system RelE/ParE family toxin [Pinibacter aurantiacus]MBV4359826.1 type II toxin-antitoxin system RelE/ParE family toxin [Pinibacter aurantiacus]